MTASEFYNNPKLIETFGRSKLFNLCRRMREQVPAFPQYEKPVNNYHAAWLIYLLAKSGSSTTPRVIANSIRAGKELKMGNDLFVAWLGDLLADPERIKRDIVSIWLFESSNYINVIMNTGAIFFQGEEKVKQVNKAIQLSAQFLYDFAMNLNVKDESLDSEIVFEAQEEED